MSSASHSQANPTATAFGPADGQPASGGESPDNARHIAWIREMGEMAMRMAETLHDQVTGATDAPDVVKRLPELCLAFTRVTRCARLAVVLEQELLGLRPVAVRRAAANGNLPGFGRGERENGDGGDREAESWERFAEYDNAALEARIEAEMTRLFPYGVPSVKFDPADPDNPLYLGQIEARREGTAHIEAILLHGEDVEWPPKTGLWSKPLPLRDAYHVWCKAERERLRLAAEGLDACASEGEPHQRGPPLGGEFR